MDKAQSHQTSKTPAAPKDERAGRMLDRMAEMAMERAEALHTASLDAIRDRDAVATREFELAFDRLGRGLRQTLALQAYLARQDREAVDKEAAGARARATEKAERRNTVARVVAHSICSDQNLDFRTSAHLAHGMWEQLAEREIDEALALAEHPIEEIVLRLCRDIGVKPELVLLLDPDGPAARTPPRRYANEGWLPDEADDVDEWWPHEGPDKGRYWYRTRDPLKHPGIVTGWYDMELGGPIEGLPWDQPPDPG
jgi:hypothetical protein